MKLLNAKNALLCLAACTVLTGANAQTTATPVATCAADEPMTDKQLQGEWNGSIEGQSGTIRLVLSPHPEWEGTVKGKVNRPGSSYPMVGDVNDNTVTLEESADGLRITGTWLGSVTEGSCAREIRGNFQAGENAPLQPFVLHKDKP